MKHPIDTSAWGEFLLNDIATLTNGNKFDKNKMSHDKPSINFVSRTGFNNGISDFVDKIDGVEPYPAGAITLALGGSVGSTFVQPKPFYTGQNVGVIEFENKSDKMKQFVAIVLNKVCSTQFSAFKNEINKHFKRDLSIPLPLKPSADPSNYDSTDIDWNYMETVMSRVMARAKERLANLPQPTDKQKTPVDTSAWGEFVVGELFDVHPTKAYKLKNSELLTPNGKNPVVVNSSYNNGIGGYTDQELTELGGILTFSDTTSGADTLFFQKNSFVGYPHVQGMYPKTFQLTTNVAKFMIASLRASINKYSWNYTNKLTRTFITSTTIKLPLKPSANPSNYTQDDIDWDYMENFMKTIEEKAQTRLKTLQQSIA